MNILPVLLKDFYKADHRRQYPDKTELVYSNWTARYSRLPMVHGTVVFGVQYFVKEYLIRQFEEHFFKKPKSEVVRHYKTRMDLALGPNEIGTDHIEALHDLGYLPLKIKSLPEGTVCPLRVPILTVKNTLPEFFWVTNFIETLLSNVLWHPMTTATITRCYREVLDGYAEITSDMPDFVDWQGHDFSMRGQTSVESSLVSSGAHLTSFTGTDTIAAIDWLEVYYNANAGREVIGGSVPATEHSVMCMGGKLDERETYRRLLEDVYPKGVVSVVSDTWDYWKVLTEILPTLKDAIMGRDGKLVIRPDSGDPVKIICGDPEAPTGTSAHKGTIQILWEIFGGAENSKGYKQLDPHIGCIYGDSITLERCDAICAGLMAKGFASTNMVFGIGSYTYQYVTRDTFGFAMKATYGVVDGEKRILQKTPATDSGVKFSARGLLAVFPDGSGSLKMAENCSDEEEESGELVTVFENGKLVHETTLAAIRDRLKGV